MSYPSAAQSDPFNKLLRWCVLVVCLWFGFVWLGAMYRLLPIAVTMLAVINVALAFMIHQRARWLERCRRIGWLQRYLAWIGTQQGDSSYSDPAKVATSPEILLHSPRDFRSAEWRGRQVLRGHDRVFSSVLMDIQNSLGLRKHRRHGTAFGPIASTLLVGPVGIGKRYMARVVAKLLYRHASVAVFVCDQLTIDKLVGNGIQPGELLSSVRQHPFCTILFEHVDRADPAVLQLIEQLITTGRIRPPASDQEVSFQNTTVFCTIELESAALTKLTQLGHSGLAGQKRIRETLSQECNVNPRTLSQFSSVYYCAPPEDEVKAEVLALLMQSHCDDQHVDLVYTDPEIFVSQIAQLDQSGVNFTDAPAQVRQMLVDPLVAAADAKQKQLALRVSREQPLAVER